MLISTADMKPTFYVSGLQSLSFKDSRPKDTMVTRVWQHGVTVPYPSPAIISPKEPSTMLLCVGSGAQGPEDGSQPSAPLIQSFDLSTFQSRWKQALTRTNATDFDITSQGLPIVEPRVSHLAAAGDGTWIASIDEWAPSQKIDSMPEVLQGGKEVFLKFWDAAADSSEMRLMSRINSPHQTDLSGVVLDLSGDPTSNRFATLGDDSTVQLWRPRRRQRDGIDAKDDKGNVLQTWSCSQTIVLGETAGIRQDEVLKPSAGRLVFSEDGSALFAAYTRALDVDSMSDTSLTASMETVDVYVVDCALGQVRHVLPQLAHGTVRGLASLGRSVVVLTTRELVVYDVVADELVYGVSVGSGDAAIPGWATPYVHLAADSRSGTFAVAIPLVDETSASTQTQLDRTTPTELAVFDPEKLGGVTGPLAVHRLPHSLLNLVAGASAGAGYVAVDVLAQVWTVAEARNADALVVAKPLADMDLDTVELDGVSLDRGADDGDDDDMRDVAMGGVDGEEEDEVDLSVHAAVVTQQKLTEIFDVGPGSASLSIEDMFYSVAKLFAPKPLKRATDGDTVTAAA